MENIITESSYENILSKEDILYLFNLSACKNEMIVMNLIYTFNCFLKQNEDMRRIILDIIKMVKFDNFILI